MFVFPTQGVVFMPYWMVVIVAIIAYLIGKQRGMRLMYTNAREHAECAFRAKAMKELELLRLASKLSLEHSLPPTRLVEVSLPWDRRFIGTVQELGSRIVELDELTEQTKKFYPEHNHSL